MEPETSGIYFNPWDTAFRDNPYPYYSRLLNGPPLTIDLFGQPAVIVARFADVTAVLRDYARFSSIESRPPEMADQGPFRGATTMLFSDPPVHERLRRLVSRDFTPRRIRELEPRIRAIAAELLDNVVRKGAFDVMADLANVLPVMVIAEMLGIPPAHYAHF